MVTERLRYFQHELKVFANDNKSVRVSLNPFSETLQFLSRDYLPGGKNYFTPFISLNLGVNFVLISAANSPFLCLPYSYSHYSVSKKFLFFFINDEKIEASKTFFMKNTPNS